MLMEQASYKLIEIQDKDLSLTLYKFSFEIKERFCATTLVIK